MQVEASRCAPRPGNALRPGLLIIRIIGLSPGGATAAKQHHNPQGHTRDCGQHIVRQSGQWNKEGALERNPIEVSFRDIYRDGRSLGSRQKLSGSGCCHCRRSGSFTVTERIEQSSSNGLHILLYYPAFYCTTVV